MNRAQEIVNTLLETESPTFEESDRITELIQRVLRKHGAHGAVTDPRGFEKEINPIIAQYGIRFDSEDKIIKAYGTEGYSDIDGIVLKVPDRFDDYAMLKLNQVIAHELEHAHQTQQAMLTGNAAQMHASALRRILPGGKLNYTAYHNQPQETSAYAKSAINQMRQSSLTRQQALQQLRTRKHLPFLSATDPKEIKRFRKRAYRYAQQLPKP